MFNYQKAENNFFVFRNWKWDVFKKYILFIFSYFLKIILKNNYTNIKIIKHIVLHKNITNSLKYFYFPYRLPYITHHKIILKNTSQSLLCF